MLEMLSAPDSLLCKVKFFGVLGVPVATLPKLYEAGVSVASATPVPLSDEVSVLYGVGASSFTVKVADSAPSALGVNVTLMVHDFPAAKLLPQVVLVWEKSVLSSVILILFSVTDW
jgi:hypothetical protein